MATSVPASGWLRGKVKAVTSGDCLVIMGSTRAEIPPEKTITLSSLIAPRLARRGGVDEPFAWESREYLRKLCIGKEVTFRVDYTVSSIGREFGSVFLGDKNLAVLVVQDGWAKVRDQGQQKGEASPYLAELLRLEEIAKQQGFGRWSKEPGASEAAIRDLPPSAIGDASNFDAMALLASNKGGSMQGIVEQVRDGSTVRVYLLPDFQFVQVFVAGVQVRIVLEGVDKFSNLIGSVYYPDGDSAKDLALDLVENCKHDGNDAKRQLKTAELKAKKDRLRMWTNYVPPDTNSKAIHNQNFTGKVVEVVSGDCIIVADDAVPYGNPLAERRVNLSSIRSPKIGNPRRDEKPATMPVKLGFLRTRLLDRQMLGSWILGLSFWCLRQRDGYDTPQFSSSTVNQPGRIEVETVDRNGTFLDRYGSHKTNAALNILEAGLAKLQTFGADRIPEFTFLHKLSNLQAAKT
ncbi:hypothetical protein GIB67_009589 [Kingdonia uniflora]|uniref:TNase-like domain-containing protein n=1 Tax=Kingdonia uniflora TaxID=39325 RepID=A0A7J7LPM7_9MAGN|nr:hypothetical protein GIB67_009589 [Kingdonia uniflora]